jgi:hypothetical protein
VFLSALGAKYEYELEGFQTKDKATRYLPDFWLPELKVWAEVKPDVELNWAEWSKVLTFVSAVGPVLLLKGKPGTEPVHRIFFKGADGDRSNGRGWVEDYVSWTHAQGHHMGRNIPPGPALVVAGGTQPRGLLMVAHRVLWGSMPGVTTTDTPVERAVERARAARFEFGESG